MTTKKLLVILFLISSIISFAQNEFITTWETTVNNETITIPTTGAGHNYTVDWGDGTIENAITGDAVHTYATAGIQTIEISGDFPRIYFNLTGDRNKIQTIVQWGNIQWTSMEKAFMGCSNLQITATDAPNFSNMTSLSYMFFGCRNLNNNINHWNVSTIENMYALFQYAITFDQPLNNWDVKNVNNMEHMFNTANSFDQNLSTWDISSVNNMISMFNGDNVALSTTNYDATLIGWATLDTANGETEIPTDINFVGGNSQYCVSEIKRQELIDVYGWTITDSGINNILTPNLTTLTDIITCSSVTNLITPTASEFCSGNEIIGTHNITLPITETTTITWTYTNGIDIITQTQEVIINDIENPIAICQDITLQLDENGNASITVPQIDNGSTDNCGIASMSLSRTDFTCADIPNETTVILTVTDQNGNSSTCNASVFVADNTNPTLTCTNFGLILDENGEGIIIPSDLVFESNDNCGIASTTISIDTFDCTFLRETPVTVTVTDFSGNSTSCIGHVTIDDQSNPIAICQDITVQLDENGDASITTSQIDNGSTDNCGITASFLDVNSFTCADIGNNTVIFTTIDAVSNETTCTAIVTVEDILPPTINCPSDFTVDPGVIGTAYIVPDFTQTTGFSVTDNCTDIAGIVTTQLPIIGTNLNDGIHTITVTSEDEFGNSANCTFQLTVDSTLGISSNLIEEHVLIYPNPTSNSITIEIEGNTTFKQVIIYDILGKKLLSSKKNKIDIVNLEKGTYFLRIIDNLDNIVIKKIVKKS